MIKKEYIEDYLKYGFSDYMSTYNDDDRFELSDTLNQIEYLEATIQAFVEDGMPYGTDRYSIWFSESFFPKGWTDKQKSLSVLNDMKDKLKYYKDYFCDYCQQCRERT